jgi:hypothetical protein
MRTTLASTALVCSIAVACAPTVKRIGNSPTSAEMAQFWSEPTGPHNLFAGPPSIVSARPRVDARYTVVKRDTRGFSTTYRVRDERSNEWNIKIGPEAQTEVVSSRIVWALGYHALPSSFVERWIAVDNAKGAMLGGGRFRPHELGLKSLGTWSWQENPYVGTKPYNGLLALMMILNSTDLKNDNNELFELTRESRDAASRWYVVKDLGASLGETGRIDPRRGDVDSFEREPFVRGVSNGHVRFGYRGRHQELLDDRIAVDDVKWICERLQKISDAQWRDAFRAGGYSEDVSARYIARLHSKIAEGLKLQ